MKHSSVGVALLALFAGVAGCKTIVVESVPTGAKVKSGEVNGPAPVEIQTFAWQKWFGSPKMVTVSKDGYLSRTVPVTMSSPSTLVVALDRKFNIKANVDGAAITVDGAARGKTPAKAVAINDAVDSVVAVSKKGWVKAQMTVTPDTPTDIELVMEQDGPGRYLLDLIPQQDGVRVKSTSIHSDMDVGERSPNVAQTRRLTSQGETEYIQSFSLLPDGQTLIASIIQEEEQKDGTIRYWANLWQMDAVVGKQKKSQLTFGDVFDITPSPSVDGETLYFATTRNGKPEIWSRRINAKGGLKTLTSSNTADFSPSVNPAGDTMLYSAVLPSGKYTSYLWTKAADGSGMPSQMCEGYNGVWSPDGKRFLFVNGSREENKARIYVMDADGGNVEKLNQSTEPYNDIDPHWSPDGSKIVFASSRGKVNGRNNYDIWTMDPDGGNLTQLTTNSSCDDRPVFSNDGKSVYFRSNRGLVWDIWVMDLN